METFEIMITETLSRIVTVEAKSKEEAIEKVTKLYKEDEYVLDYNDFSGYKITDLNCNCGNKDFEVENNPKCEVCWEDIKGDTFELDGLTMCQKCFEYNGGIDE